VPVVPGRIGSGSSDMATSLIRSPGWGVDIAFLLGRDLEVETSVARRARRSRRGGRDLPVPGVGGAVPPVLASVAFLLPVGPVGRAGRQDATGADVGGVGATQEGRIRGNPSPLVACRHTSWILDSDVVKCRLPVGRRHGVAAVVCVAQGRVGN
jgi:hypothetical protein